MAKKMCICKVCGKEFDRNTEQAVIAGSRRYAHYSCMPEGELVPMEIKPASAKKQKKEEEANDLKKLKDYISQLFGDSAKWAVITKQIKDYIEKDKYTYSGILKSLIWFYEIKKNPKEKANGTIAIVKYCYQDSYNYYYNLFITQQNTQDKVLENKTKEFIIKPPIGKGTKKRLMEWEIDE